MPNSRRGPAPPASSGAFESRTAGEGSAAIDSTAAGVGDGKAGGRLASSPLALADAGAAARGRESSPVRISHHVSRASSASAASVSDTASGDALRLMRLLPGSLCRGLERDLDARLVRAELDGTHPARVVARRRHPEKTALPSARVEPEATRVVPD